MSGDIGILICKSSCGLCTKYMTYCYLPSLAVINLRLSKIRERFVRTVKSDDGLPWEIRWSGARINQNTKNFSNS